jgi:hypothetical protein
MNAFAGYFRLNILVKFNSPQALIAIGSNPARDLGFLHVRKLFS